MATMLITSTYGSDDPTRATLAFLYANGAVEAGHEPQIVLQGEATNLMKDSIAEAVHGVGWPPLNELLPKVIEQGIPIHV